MRMSNKKCPIFTALSSDKHSFARIVRIIVGQIKMPYRCLLLCWTLSLRAIVGLNITEYRLLLARRYSEVQLLMLAEEEL